MNLIEALKKDMPIRLKGRTFSYSNSMFSDVITHIHPKAWIDPLYLLDVIKLTKEDILSNKGEVKKKSKK